MNQCFHHVIMNHTNVENSCVELHSIHLTKVYPRKSSKITLRPFLFPEDSDGKFGQAFVNSHSIGDLIELFGRRIFASINNSMLVDIW